MCPFQVACFLFLYDLMGRDCRIGNTLMENDKIIANYNCVRTDMEKSPTGNVADPRICKSRRYFDYFSQGKHASFPLIVRPITV